MPVASRPRGCRCRWGRRRFPGAVAGPAAFSAAAALVVAWPPVAAEHAAVVASARPRALAVGGPVPAVGVVRALELAADRALPAWVLVAAAAAWAGWGELLLPRVPDLEGVASTWPVGRRRS